jgi:hypothetical protein
MGNGYTAKNKESRCCRRSMNRNPGIVDLMFLYFHIWLNHI